MESARGSSFFTVDEDDDYDYHGAVVVPVESTGAGFSGDGASGSQTHSVGHHNQFSSRGSLRHMPYMGSPAASPRSGRLHYEPRMVEDQRTHFLDSCALCKKPLSKHRDIFMYRGDMAFCSEDCRQEQMEMDEARDKNRSFSSLRKKDQRNSSTTSPSKCPLRTGTVAAA